MSQRAAALALSPPWLQYGSAEGEAGGVGGPFMYNLGLAQDAAIDKLLQGLYARLPGLGTPTTLPYIGKDRVLVQGPNETTHSFAARCRQALRTWTLAGAPRAKLQALRGFFSGYAAPPSFIGQVDNTGNWNWYWPADDPTQAPEHLATSNWDWDGLSKWYRIWVVIGNGPWVPEGNWGDGSLWGDIDLFPAGTPNTIWGAVVGSGSNRIIEVQGNWISPDPPKFFGWVPTWGSSATLAEVTAILSLVKAWKGAHAVEISTIIRFNDARLNPYFASPSVSNGGPMPNGHWGTYYNTTSGGDVVPSRDTSARYWSQVN